jgi:hypothetical protein
MHLVGIKQYLSPTYVSAPVEPSSGGQGYIHITSISKSDDIIILTYTPQYKVKLLLTWYIYIYILYHQTNFDCNINVTLTPWRWFNWSWNICRGYWTILDNIVNLLVFWNSNLFRVISNASHRILHYGTPLFLHVLEQFTQLLLRKRPNRRHI